MAMGVTTTAMLCEAQEEEAAREEAVPDRESLRSIHGLLQKALDHGGNTHSMDDVLDDIEEGRVQLHADPPEAVIITEILDHPQARELNLWLAAGELDPVVQLARHVTQWGKAQGCTRAMFLGRRGWRRVAERLSEEGWKEDMILMRKKL